MSDRARFTRARSGGAGRAKTSALRVAVVLVQISQTELVCHINAIVDVGQDANDFALHGWIGL